MPKLELFWPTSFHFLAPLGNATGAFAELAQFAQLAGGRVLDADGDGDGNGNGDGNGDGEALLAPTCASMSRGSGVSLTRDYLLEEAGFRQTALGLSLVCDVFILLGNGLLVLSLFASGRLVCSPGRPALPGPMATATATATRRHNQLDRLLLVLALLHLASVLLPGLFWAYLDAATRPDGLAAPGAPRRLALLPNVYAAYQTGHLCLQLGVLVVVVSLCLDRLVVGLQLRRACAAMHRLDQLSFAVAVADAVAVAAPRATVKSTSSQSLFSLRAGLLVAGLCPAARLVSLRLALWPPGRAAPRRRLVLLVAGFVLVCLCIMLVSLACSGRALQRSRRQRLRRLRSRSLSRLQLLGPPGQTGCLAGRTRAKDRLRICRPADEPLTEAYCLCPGCRRRRRIDRLTDSWQQYLSVCLLAACSGLMWTFTAVSRHDNPPSLLFELGSVGAQSEDTCLSDSGPTVRRWPKMRQPEYSSF
ncbi:unnamed protein product [Protopolystoma xenopodis]|uniref:Uncharacterized protein n=1 Tax=Protopolystoma xenopodis TaxID=117903 RepID=A0A3S5B669_9PLAT|nr:unnamed protein product [Protopolystoma xenopodis]